MPGVERLSPESWDHLYDFLDPHRRDASGPARDRQAEARFEEVFHRLVTFFAGRQCRDAEDLAVEVVLRVAARCRDVDIAAYPDRTGYFYGVARNVLHEAYRSSTRESHVNEAFKREVARRAGLDAEDWRQREAVQSCLDRCMDGLPSQTRQWFVRYHSRRNDATRPDRGALAAELGKSVNALRIEVYRLRRSLRQCVTVCLQSVAQEPAGAPGR